MATHIPQPPDLKFKTPPRLAILVSRFNTEVTGGLRDGAVAWLEERHIHDVDIYDAPGAFELPIMAQALARQAKYDGVICVGCVIKGDTAHFEFISLGTTIGIMNAQLATGKPISFGVLTTYHNDQAVSRSRDDIHNKGREAAAACLETIAFLRQQSENP